MTSASPRLLLVEDDPVSRAFLVAALQPLPASIDAADTAAAAFVLAATHRYDLWLFDANLPDGSGIDLLTRLRSRGLSTPALAHTAGDDALTAEALLAAGFLQVLIKPLPVGSVQAAVLRALGKAAHGDAVSSLPCALWDDDAAARALNGNREHVAALRTLFLAELPGVQARVIRALDEGDFAGLRAELHRLRASCGFVGATGLGAAAHGLHGEASAARLSEFTAAVQRLLESVGRQSGNEGDEDSASKRLAP